MENVLNVADAFLKLAKRQHKKLTPLQLMKLVYIAYGFFIAKHDGKKLFSSPIQAWKFGPVIPELYHNTKQFGRNPIDLSEIDDDEASVSPDAMEVIEKVYERYGGYDGIALSSLTHRYGTPWYKSYIEGIYNRPISDDLIIEHYRNKPLH